MQTKDTHLAEEVRVNLRRISSGVAEANMKQVATYCGLSFGPLAELPEVPQAPPE